MERWGWTDKLLGRRVKLLPGEKTRHVYLTPDELGNLVDAARLDTVREIIAFAALTGLRRSETLSLRANQIRGPRSLSLALQKSPLGIARAQPHEHLSALEHLESPAARRRPSRAESPEGSGTPPRFERRDRLGLAAQPGGAFGRPQDPLNKVQVQLGGGQVAVRPGPSGPSLGGTRTAVDRAQGIHADTERAAMNPR